ncbi:MAG: hypothetical protein AAF353_17425 [Pseudomonadota bacterium]
MGVTMLTLARFTLKGPYQAAGVVGLLAVLSVLIPLMAPNTGIGVLAASLCMLLSCVLVGLIILTQGSTSGLKAIGFSILGITVVSWGLINSPELGLWTGLVQWLPIILLAQTLRSSKSLALTMLLGVLLGTVGILTQHLLWTDIEAQWTEMAVQRLQQMGEVDPQLLERNIQLIKLFVVALIAMAYLLMVSMVLLARWMQAKLAESERFAQEFQALSLGRGAAMAALVVTGLAFWLKQPWINSLMLLMVVAFLFQGIAVIHSKLTTKRQSKLLLGLFYALLMIFPQVVALTSLVGVIDNWLVFSRSAENTDD